VDVQDDPTGGDVRRCRIDPEVVLREVDLMPGENEGRGGAGLQEQQCQRRRKGQRPGRGRVSHLRRPIQSNEDLQLLNRATREGT
jgi:hypothetical protein